MITIGFPDGEAEKGRRVAAGDQLGVGGGQAGAGQLAGERAGGHVEGVVGAVDDMPGAHRAGQEAQRARSVRHRVEPEPGQVRRRGVRAAAGLGADPVPMVQPADLVGQVTAAVSEHEPQRGQLVQRPAEDQPGRADRGGQRVADQVGEVEVREPGAGADVVRVHDQRHPEVRGGGQHRARAGVIQRGAGHVRADLRPAHAQFGDRPAQFGGRRRRVLHGQRGDRGDPAARAGREGGQLVVHLPAEPGRLAAVRPVHEQLRGDREDGAVDAALVHRPQPRGQVVERRRHRPAEPLAVNQPLGAGGPLGRHPVEPPSPAGRRHDAGRGEVRVHVDGQHEGHPPARPRSTACTQAVSSPAWPWASAAA